MKNLFTVFLVSAVLLGAAASSRAALFSSNVNFSGSGTYDDQDYRELIGKRSTISYVFGHTVRFSPAAEALSSISLTLSHHGNSNSTSGELWIVYDSSRTLLGTLSDSTGLDWVEQAFVVPVGIVYQKGGGLWSFALKVQNSTPGAGPVIIDRSVLSGTYTPVPLPPALFLFGSGLSGLIFFRRT